MTYQPTPNELGTLVGKKISEICPCGYVDAGANHCAHFVSHIAKYKFGYTCFADTGKGSSSDGATVRVVDLFPKCRRVGVWSDRPKDISCGLIFITDKSNVHLAKKTIDNVRKKHVGFFIGDVVWHYSNTQGKVVTQTSQQFSHHYPGSGITMFYGEFPI
ncbi:MAG: hypothetical protein ABI539_09825 [Acidobacteriota bacterium]